MQDADARDDAVGGQLGIRVVGEQAVLDELGLRIEEPRDADAWHQLALLGHLASVPFRTSRACPLQPRVDLRRVVTA